MRDGSVVWPYRVEGWYWAPEAALVADDPDAEFLEALVFDEDDPADRPFAWLGEYYDRRNLLKRIGNPAEYTFKLIINSVYGQLAQRTGWDRVKRRAPKSHQLEWAGYITSACRSEVYRIARRCAERLVSIDTDSVTFLGTDEGYGIDVGDGLGQWDVTNYSEAIFWQSGIYTLREPLDYDDSLGYGWHKARTRGIPKGSYTVEQLLECVETGEPLRLAKKVFVSYGLALAGRWGELNTWKNEPHEFAMGGSGKRTHFTGNACKSVCDDADGHRLAMPQMLYGPDCDPWSMPHHLPWLDEPGDTKIHMDDLSLWDANDLDYDDEWVREYG